MLCVDANIWIYYLDERMEEHGRAAGELDDALDNEKLFLNTVIQMEVVHYLVRQLPEDQHVEAFLNLDDVVVGSLEPKDVATASELMRNHEETGVGGRDCILLASMRKRGVRRLWTHDTDLKKLAKRLDWLRVNDPVER